MLQTELQLYRYTEKLDTVMIRSTRYLLPQSSWLINITWMQMKQKRLRSKALKYPAKIASERYMNVNEENPNILFVCWYEEKIGKSFFRPTLNVKYLTYTEWSCNQVSFQIGDYWRRIFDSIQEIGIIDLWKILGK